MDILTIVLLTVILILIIINKASISKQISNLEYRIVELQAMLKKQAQENKQAETQSKTSEEPAPARPTVQEKAQEPPKPVQPEIPKPKEEFEPLPVVFERQPEVISDSLAGIRKPVKQWQPEPEADREPELSFFERYPDLEKFIGENLVNKIGIFILVLAIGFFVKYAIDNDWIGPVGRVGIGVLCAGILIGFAHSMRNSYKAFSSVLVGGGLAVLYFTITLAYQEFHLFSQVVALAVLSGITIFAVVLSLLYDKQELAVIALIGGFSSPFMASNGTSNYNGLFLYLLILNAGLLIIAYYKSWRILNISSFALSLCIFIAVLATVPASGYIVCFRYATIYYLLFFTINIINNVRQNKTFLAIDFTILLVNTALYFAAGLYLLTEMNLPEYRGLFSACLAAINLVLSYILFRNRKVDPNILYLLIGITLSFISITAPIQLHGHNITLFWATETALLYWLYQKSGIALMKLTSLLVWLAMMVSWLMDINKVYGGSDIQLVIIANKGFITTIVAALSSYLLYILLKKDEAPQIYGMAISKNLYRIIALVLLFLSGLLEINYQFSFYYPDNNIHVLYVMLYVPAFVYLLILISNKVNAAAINWRVSLALLVAAITIYLALTPVSFELLADMLDSKKIASSHFYVRWISDIFIGLLLYKLIILCRDNFDEGLKTTASWILSAAVVLFFSLELCLVSEMIFHSKINTIDTIQTVYIKTALPVLWGIISFVLMWMGMRNKERALRIVSLTLFLVTLVKLFMFDINNIPVAGKIAAFFCLGVLLLIISFMYQKVKKIIVDDEAKPKD